MHGFFQSALTTVKTFHDKVDQSFNDALRGADTSDASLSSPHLLTSCSKPVLIVQQGTNITEPQDTFIQEDRLHTGNHDLDAHRSKPLPPPSSFPILSMKDSGVTEETLTVTPDISPPNDEYATDSISSYQSQTVTSPSLPRDQHTGTPKTSFLESQDNNLVEMLRSRNEELEQALITLTQQHRVKLNELQTSEKYCEDLASEGLNLSKRLGIFETKLKQVKNDLQTAEANFAASNDREQKAKAEIKTLQREVLNFKSVSSDLELQLAQSQQLKDELASVSVKANDLSIENQQLKENQKNFISIVQYETDIENVCQEKDSFKQLHQIVKEKLEIAESHWKALEVDYVTSLKSLKKQNEMLEKALEQSKMESMAVAGKLSQQLWSLEAQLKIKDDVLQQQTLLIQQTKQNSSIQQESLHRLSLDEETNKLRIKEEEFFSKQKELQQEINALNNKIILLTSETTSLKSSTNEFQQREQNLQLRLQSSQKRCAEVIASNTALKKQIDTLKLDYEKLTHQQNTSAKIQPLAPPPRPFAISLFSQQSIPLKDTVPSWTRVLSNSSSIVANYSGTHDLNDDPNNSKDTDLTEPEFGDEQGSFDINSGRRSGSRSLLHPINHNLLEDAGGVNQQQIISMLRADLEAANTRISELEGDCVHLTTEIGQLRYLSLENDNKNQIAQEAARQALEKNEKLYNEMEEQREMVEMYKTEVKELTDRLAGATLKVLK